MSDECTICSHHFDADDPEAFPGLCPDCNTEKNRAAKLDMTVEEYRKRFPACDSDQSSLRVLDLLLPIGTCCRCGLESRTYDAGNDERMCLPCARKERAVIASRLVAARKREKIYEKRLLDEQERFDVMERKSHGYSMRLLEARREICETVAKHGFSFQVNDMQDISFDPSNYAIRRGWEDPFRGRCKSTCPHGDRCTLPVDHEHGHNHAVCECNEPNDDADQATALAFYGLDKPEAMATAVERLGEHTDAVIQEQLADYAKRVEQAASALFVAASDPRMHWDVLDDVSKGSWRTAIRDEIANVGQPLFSISVSEAAEATTKANADRSRLIAENKRLGVELAAARELVQIHERLLFDERGRADSLERRAAEYAMQLDEEKVQPKRDEAVKAHLRLKIQSQEFALETRNLARLWALDTASDDAKEDAAADAGYAAGYKAGYEASSADAVALLRT